nr:hypothetical protein [Tanacetum cinerariifolium]
MPGLEDIIYYDDEDVVGAKADFNNLGSTIPVSPIPTTRIHKGYPVSKNYWRNLRGHIKLLKIIVRLNPCKKSFFNSRCKKFGSSLIRLMEKEQLEEGIDYEEVFAPVARIEAI